MVPKLTQTGTVGVDILVFQGLHSQSVEQMLAPHIGCLLVNHDAISSGLFNIEFDFLLVLVGLAIEPDGLVAQTRHKLAHGVGQLLAAHDAPVEIVHLLVQLVLLDVLGEDQLAEVAVWPAELLPQFGHLEGDVEGPVGEVLVLAQEDVVGDCAGDYLP